MIKPTEQDIGRAVVYLGRVNRTRWLDGVITSFNDEYVFVRYVGQHPSADGQGTRREDLKWMLIDRERKDRG